MVRQVGHLQELYRDARPTEHKIIRNFRSPQRNFQQPCLQRPLPSVCHR